MLLNIRMETLEIPTEYEPNEDSNLVLIGSISALLIVGGILYAVYKNYHTNPPKPTEKPDPTETENPPKPTEKPDSVDSQIVDINDLKYNDKPLTEFDKKLLNNQIDWNSIPADAEIKLEYGSICISYDCFQHIITLYGTIDHSGSICYDGYENYTKIMGKDIDKIVLKKDLSTAENAEITKGIDFFNSKIPEMYNELLKYLKDNAGSIEDYDVSDIKSIVNIIRISHRNICIYLNNKNELKYLVCEKCLWNFSNLINLFKWNIDKSIIGKISIPENKIAKDRSFDNELYGSNHLLFQLQDDEIRIIHTDVNNDNLGAYLVNINNISDSDLQKDIIINIFNDVSDFILKNNDKNIIIKAIANNLGLLKTDQLKSLMKKPSA
jgi:hypothetical protein